MGQYRIVNPQGRLSGSTESVATGAEACGHANAFYFSRAFKKVVGDSPLKWRKRARRAVP